MKNKKGFTLVELLAVIAILAILMLLIMPNVLKMYKNGKTDTFKTQVESIIRTAYNQKQTDALSKEEKNMYCFGVNNECTIDNKLSVTDGDIKYVVIFDNNNKIAAVAVQNSSYCYINTSDTTNIDSNDFVEKGELSCTTTSCTCGATNVDIPEMTNENVNETRTTVYWATNEVGANNTYAIGDTLPAYKMSVSELGLSQPARYAKSIINQNSKIIDTEVCVTVNNKEFCVSENNWKGSPSATATVLREEMNSAGVVPVSCTELTAESYCHHSYYGSCGYNIYNASYCWGSVGYCYVNADGSAFCTNG